MEHISRNVEGDIIKVWSVMQFGEVARGRRIPALLHGACAKHRRHNSIVDKNHL